MTEAPYSSVPILRDPLFVGVLLLLGGALGRRVLIWMGVGPVPGARTGRALLGLAIGVALLQAPALLLGAMGKLTTGPILLALCLLSAALVVDAAAVLRFTIRRVRSVHRLTELEMAALTVIASCCLAALLQALSPPTDADGLGYHLTAPRRWLHAGSLAYLPGIPHTNAPMGLEAIYTLCLALWSDTSAKVLHWALGVGCIAGIWNLARRIGGRWAGWTAALLMAPGVPRFSVLPLMGSAYVDLGLLILTLVSAFAWLVWRERAARGDRMGWLLAAGTAAGLAASVKLTGLGVGVAILTGTFLVRRSAPVLRGGWVALWLAVTLPCAPWLVRAWLQTGNPVWPHFASFITTADWSSELGRGYGEYFRLYNWGAGFAGLGHAARASVLLAVVVAACLVWALALRSRVGQPVWSVSLLSGLVLLPALGSVGLYPRLLMPGLALAVVAACGAAARTGARALGRRARVVGLIVAVALSAMAFRGADLADSARVAMGLMSRETYLDQTLPSARFWRATEPLMPNDARVLYVGLGGTYYAPRPCVMLDPYIVGAVRLTTWREFMVDVWRGGITHVAVPADGARIPRMGPPTLSRRNEETFAQRLCVRRGRKILSSGGMNLYVLQWGDLVE